MMMPSLADTMALFHWKKPAAQKNRPLLEVVCPLRHNQSLPEMRKTIRKAVDVARRKMDESKAHAGAILFSEGENGRFALSKEDAMGEARDLQRLLPKSHAISVAFNLLEDHDDMLYCNSGYLISAQEIQSSPKRSFTQLESEIIGGIYQAQVMRKWEERTEGLRDAPYPTLRIGFDNLIEHRVCADACAPQIYFEPQTVTLISANGNVMGYYVKLMASRLAVVVNDSCEPGPTAASPSQGIMEIARGREFGIVTLFEKKDVRSG